VNCVHHDSYAARDHEYRCAESQHDAGNIGAAFRHLSCHGQSLFGILQIDSLHGSVMERIQKTPARCERPGFLLFWPGDLSIICGAGCRFPDNLMLRNLNEGFSPQ
jgi:hypothetical protein